MSIVAGAGYLSTLVVNPPETDAIGSLATGGLQIRREVPFELGPPGRIGP